jgi:hypothetical protein
MDDKNLPPLPKDAYDGEKYEAPIPRNVPLVKRCDHKGKVTLVSSIELKCSCGVGWVGQNIQKLYELLK